jgi:murein DD-endopeptidase MepM/ murein hydrolase activator NlpD
MFRSRTRACASTFGAAVLLSLASVGGAQLGVDTYSDSIGEVEGQLAAQQRKLGESRARKGQALATLIEIGPSAALARERLQRDARALYRVSRGGMLPLAGGMAALLGHASRVGRLTRIVEHDLADLAGLSKQQTSLQRELVALDAQIAGSERELASLETARAGAVRERSVHRHFESVLASGGPAERASPDRVSYGLSIIGGPVSESFRDQRGSHALPVSGPSSIQDATRPESDGPGLEFAAAQGAAVRAAAAGRVAFSETYGSYGRLVILDHGDRYYTVYGGFAQLDVQVGDHLSKSARIGSTGSGPLYFEVRRGTKTQDARAWLGL